MSKLVNLSYKLMNLMEIQICISQTIIGNYQNYKSKERYILKYKNFDNGSYNQIAGIMNKEKNFWYDASS